MKTLLLILALSVISVSNFEGETKKINQIMQSNNLSISIEKLDFGYVKNKHVYFIDKASNQVYITHRAMYENEQNNNLNSTKVNPKVIQELSDYFIQLTDFEINHKSEHDTLFNRKNNHQFITLQNQTDTLLISDVKDEGFTKIQEIIANNKL